MSDASVPPLGYHIRIGSMGLVESCRWAGGLLSRGRRVVVRSTRGLEIGEVATCITSDNTQFSGSVLRPTTGEDEMLNARLDKHRRQAVIDCQRLLGELDADVALMEVEHLFDGRTLLFHFLGEVTPKIESITNHLAEVYEQRVQTKHFAKLLAEGCGPGCGTSEGQGCGTGGCAVCVVRDACGKR